MPKRPLFGFRSAHGGPPPDLRGINTRQPPPIQPESALTAIRVLVGPVGAAILLLSFVAVYLYPITQARHAEIQAQLAARHAKG